MTDIATTLVAVIPLACAAAAVAVLVVQPTRAWHDAAEHGRAFWLSWVGACVAVGLGPLVDGFGWAGAAWLALWCALGALQPAMINDVLEVRRHLLRMERRGRRLRAEARAREREPGVRPL